MIEAVSGPPVTTVTLREAIVAVWLMLITATACVASLAVVERTLMPAPKLATLQLGAQPAARIEVRELAGERDVEVVRALGARRRMTSGEIRSSRR